MVVSLLIENIGHACKMVSETNAFSLVKQASHAQNSLKLTKPQDYKTYKLLHKRLRSLMEVKSENRKINQIFLLYYSMRHKKRDLISFI